MAGQGKSWGMTDSQGSKTHLGGGWPGGKKVGNDQIPRARRLTLGYEPASTS
jgi:hypothetical protein